MPKGHKFVGKYLGAAGSYGLGGILEKNKINFWGPVREGLSVFYDANHNSSYSGSGTSWFDISGNGVTGTLVSSPTYSTSYGGAFQFATASLKRVDITSSFNFNNDFTLEFWYMANDTVNWDWLLNFNAYSPGLTVTTNAGKVRCSYGTWFSDSQGTTGTIPTQTAGVIYQVVFQKSGTSMLTFQNGVQIGNTTTTSAGGTLPTSGTFSLAKGPATDYFSGSMYIFRAYNRALTSAEILKNFNVNRKKFGI